MDAIGTSFNGLQRGIQQLNAAHARIAGGEIEAEPIVESMIAETSIKANLKSISAILETQEAALDILA